MIRQYLYPLAVLSCLATFTCIAKAGPNGPSFAGEYKDARLVVQIQGNGGQYAGFVAMGGQQFPLTASVENDGRLVGSFTSKGTAFPFSATSNGDDLTLSTAGTTYHLQRTPVNPLQAPANPLQAPAAPAATVTPAAPLAIATPAGFSELGSTESGKTLFIKLQDAKTVEGAVQQAGDGLGKVFDTKPVFGNAVVDSQNKGKGMASFTAKAKGQDVKGIVMFAIDPQAGASVSVIYSRPDAPQAEVATLMAALPAQQKMQTFSFPDGSGTIDLPPGWTTKSTSCVEGALMIDGPQKQHILINTQILFCTPDGSLMTLYHSNVQSMRRMWEQTGRRGPEPTLPPPQGYFYPYSSPDEVVKTILPELNEKMHQAGKAWGEMGRIIESSKAEGNPYIPGAQAGLFYWNAIRHEVDGTATPIRQLFKLDTMPVGDGKDMWTLYMSGYAGPDATFDRDLPLMKDIMSTWKMDPGALKRKAERDNKNFQDMMAESERQHQNLLARGRQFQADQQDRFNRFENNERARSQARHDSSSDFIEMIRGYRDVYDSDTGKMHSVDYSNVDAITNSWNAAANDPNRFVQVPLRYQR